MPDEIDTTRVKCPEGCFIPSGSVNVPETRRQFKWYDGTMGTRRYCSRCGEELVEAE